MPYEISVDCCSQPFSFLATLTKGINDASCWISPVNGSIGSAPTRKLPFFPKRNGENLPLWANCANAMNRSSALVRRGLPAQPRSQLTPARLPDLCILRNHCVICCRRLVTFRPPCQIIAIFRRNTCCALSQWQSPRPNFRHIWAK